MLKLVLIDGETKVFGNDCWSNLKDLGLQIYRKTCITVKSTKTTGMLWWKKEEEVSYDERKRVDLMWIPYNQIKYLNEDYKNGK